MWDTSLRRKEILQVAKMGTTHNTKEHDGGPLNLATNAQYNEWNKIQLHPKVVAAKQLYEPVEKRIQYLIKALENGSGLSDTIFDEINMCIARISVIEGEVRKAENQAKSELLTIELVENDKSK